MTCRSFALSLVLAQRAALQAPPDAQSLFTELDIDPVFRSVRYSERQRLMYGHEAPQVDAAAAEAMQPPLQVFLKVPYGAK